MIQTRSETNGVRNFKTLQDALAAVREDSTIWKISFEIEDGTRIRLVQTQDYSEFGDSLGVNWVYENIMDGSRT